MPNLAQEIKRLIHPLPLTEIGLIRTETAPLLQLLDAQIAKLEKVIKAGETTTTTVSIPESFQPTFPNPHNPNLSSLQQSVNRFATVGAVVGRIRVEYDNAKASDDINTGLNLAMYNYDEGVLGANLDEIGALHQKPLSDDISTQNYYTMPHTTISSALPLQSSGGSTMLLNLHRSLNNHPLSGVFKKPVSTKEVLGYGELIRFPMDLQNMKKLLVANRPMAGGVGAGTVSNRFIREIYGGGAMGGKDSSLEGWERYHAVKLDTLGGSRAMVSLICHNVVKFNGVGSEYGEFGRTYERFCDEQFEEFIGCHKEPVPPPVEADEVEGEGGGNYVKIEDEDGNDDYDGNKRKAAAALMREGRKRTRKN
ncbi:hypothetical protein ScalyP_jg1560 [Parmales sp. scaly parma]|nr:hypothetical protein ScalyP_jg1560 [Parmales sp. scaly parma]